MVATDASAIPPEPSTWPPAVAIVATPSVPAVLSSIAAMGLVAAAAALGSADPSVVARALPALAAPALGALVLTAPALLAVHQFLGLAAAPERLVAALGNAVVAAGRIALGLVPVVLFFAATSTLWPVALAAAVAVPGIAMACVAIMGLRDAETAALVMPPRFAFLLVGWSCLALLIALRISVSMAALVLEGVPL
jgi:hypothetical protein